MFRVFAPNFVIYRHLSTNGHYDKYKYFGYTSAVVRLP